MSYVILKKAAKYSSIPIRFFEKKFLRDIKNPEERNNDIIFIVGVPRSGSTILYQVLTNYFKTGYIDNLTHLFHRNIRMGMWLSRKIFSDQPHNCYMSELGNTFDCGLHAPSECGSFWYRWLPSNKHAVTKDDLSSIKLKALKAELDYIISITPYPFIIKNLTMSVRLPLIHALYPNAKIIHVKRNIVDNAMSILNARRKLGFRDTEWWSVKPEGYENYLNQKIHNQILGQICDIENQILSDLKLFKPEDYFILEYENLMIKSDSIFSNIQKFLNLSLEKRLDFVKFKPEKRRYKDQDIDKIEFEKLLIDKGKY